VKEIDLSYDASVMEHSRSGAWTADQFRVIGIEWAPPHGWKRTVIGRQITDEQKARFEMTMRAKAARGAGTLELF
jgi:hypothetical protein